MKLFRYEEIDESHLLDELGQLKKERQSDEEQMAKLCEAQGQIDHLTKVEKTLKEYCEQVKGTLKELTYEEKRYILDELDIKVTATPEDLLIRAAIPLELTPVQSSEKFITTARTWGCQHSFTRNEASFSFEIGITI